MYRHLTNYAINKNHEDFNVDDEDYSIGHKRLLSSIFTPEMLSIVQQNISDLVIKTVISALPFLQNGYSQCKKQNPNSCFQLLGFDVLLSEGGKLNLLEVNQNPSLMTETPIDKNLKGEMVKNIFEMIEIPIASFEERNDCKIKLKDKHEMSRARNFKRVYPCQDLEDTEYYDEFIGKSQEVYKERFGINVVRNARKEENVPKVDIEHAQWNLSNEFYSREKLEKVYGGFRRVKTSQKKRLYFY